MIRIIALTAFTLTAAFHLKDWERYEADGCPFSADFPERVEVRVDTVAANWGEVLQYEYSALHDINYYSVTCTPLPVVTSAIPNIETVLDDISRQAAAENLTSFERVTVDGFSARRTVQRLGTDDAPLIVHRLNLYAKYHQYSLGVSDWDGKTEDVARFFDSFRISE